MIFQVNTKTEYGRNGQGDIYALHAPELTGDGLFEYAHSKAQALTYIKTLPAFTGIKTLGDDEQGEVFWSEWQPVEGLHTFLYGLDEAGITHWRTTITLTPLSTVFEK